MDRSELTALADRGYYSGEEIKACDDAGIVPLVPKVLTSNSKAEGRYDKSDFVYEPERDAFRCPAGEYAIRRFTSVEKGMAIHKYWSSACPRCALRAKCTTSDYRRIGRWEHEAVLDTDAGTARRQSRGDAGATANRRASVRDDQGLDGRHPLLVSTTTEGERGDEPARSGVQPEASDEDHGNRTLDRGAARLIRARILSGESPIGCRLGWTVDSAVSYHTASAELGSRATSVHGRPRFAKLSVHDGLKVKIAPVHPDFACGSWPLSLMGFAGWLLNRYRRTRGAPEHIGLCQPRSDLSCHHCMIA